jgi:hypothetical protein
MDREKVIEMILNPASRPAPGSAELRAFLAYLEKSPECRAMYEQQQAVWGALDLWEPVEPSAAFDRGVYQKIERSTAGSWGLPAWLVEPGLWLAAVRPSLAAAFAALLFIAGTIVSYQPKRNADALAARQPQAVASEVEQIDQTLDDIEMLADFDALVLETENPGRS